MIPAEAVEAAAKVLFQDSMSDGAGSNVPEIAAACEAVMRKALEAAAPYMLSNEREQTRLAHLDAMVNRETKQAELAAAWDDGHLMGWNEATANTLPERDSLWRNPYRARTPHGS